MTYLVLRWRIYFCVIIRTMLSAPQTLRGQLNYLEWKRCFSLNTKRWWVHTFIYLMKRNGSQRHCLYLIWWISEAFKLGQNCSCVNVFNEYLLKTKVVRRQNILYRHTSRTNTVQLKRDSRFLKTFSCSRKGSSKDRWRRLGYNSTGFCNIKTVAVGLNVEIDKAYDSEDTWSIIWTPHITVLAQRM
jgi:hypothetical protein